MNDKMMGSSSTWGKGGNNNSNYDYSFKILLIGDSGVGKSSLLLTFISNSNSRQDLTPTIGVDFKIKLLTVGGKRLKLTIWDTAGQERFGILTSSYYRGAHGIILVYDVTRRETFTNLSELWAKEVELYSTNQDCIKILVGNKVDRDGDEEERSSAKYIENITIPSALIEKSFGEKLQKALSGGEMVNVNLDWREAVPHPDARVEYELWTNSNDECGYKCDMLMEFVKDFKGAAQILEKGGYTQFTPHYITWYCPQAFTISKQCKSQCINHGRYCAPDPEQDFSKGYEGKDVVLENLRQLCVFRVANETNKPWVWWDYVTDFQIRCPMKDKKYNKDCADNVIRSLGLDLKKIEKCMGDPNADSDNAVLKEEQDAQVGKGSRGDVTILPTLVVNNRQYRGKLEKGAVLKAICAGFEETTEPAVCLSGDVETNECLDNNGGCWQDKASNITACKDTFRGKVCECPLVDGVQFKGDGYSSCQASGPGRCKINNGGCWHETRDGRAYSACLDIGESKCMCPPGFKGDGIKSCEDIDECKEKKACQCPECSCKNTWGSYECTCSGDLLYITDHDTCISKRATEVRSAWGAVWVILIGLGMAAGGAYMVYKYRLRSYMDSEIRAIMAQYMPLDSQAEVPNHVSEDRA